MHARIQSYLQKLPRPHQQALLKDLRAPSSEALQKTAAQMGVSREDLQQALPEIASWLQTGAAKYGDRATSLPPARAAQGAVLAQFRFSDFVPEGNKRMASLSRDHAFAADFPAPKDISRSLQALRTDLAGVPAAGGGNVLEKIEGHPVLSAMQKERVLSILAEVRDAYFAKMASAKQSGAPVDYQQVNWQHTRAEIDFVLASADANGLDAKQSEDALLASIFSDAVKTPQNFITHNLDGAAAAAEVLPRYFDAAQRADLERMEGIVRAVEEHQIGPPSFMGQIIARGMMTGKLTGNFASTETGKSLMKKVGNPFAFSPDHREEVGRQIAGTENGPVLLGNQALPLSADERQLLSQALEQAAARDSAAHKIANPFEFARRVSPKVHQIEFTAAEREVLAHIGVARWAVPDPQSAHYAASRAVIDGDSLVNYATPEGFAKIVAIRGPGTSPFFADARMEDSLQSARQSYTDAFVAMTPQAQEIAERQKQKTEGIVQKVMADLRAWLQEEKDVPRNPDGRVPFLDADLRYPPGNDVQRIAELSSVERAQFELAGRLRNKAVELLKAAHAEGVA